MLSKVRKVIGVAVIAVVLGLAIASAFLPDVSIDPGVYRALVILAGTLLGLDATRDVLIQYESDREGRAIRLEWGDDE